MRTISYAAFGIVAALGFGACTVTTTTSHGPTITAVTPTATYDSVNNDYIVDLTVEFDDSASGDLVDAYTFQTDDGQIDDVDVAIPESASPITISGIILPASYSGDASLGFHLELYGSTTGIGSTFDGTIDVVAH